MSTDFLGKGPAFPFRLDATQTKPAFSSDEDLIFESIESILNTDIGERPHRVKNGVPYGTRFRSLLFSSVDAAVDVAKFDARNALDTWEPRIIVITVDVFRRRDPVSQLFGVLLHIVFRYRTDNRTDNYVTFYRTKPFEEELT
jgi:phage baseplate assembly protein W